jgi:uncharacterized protein with PQ loop repeat
MDPILILGYGATSASIIAYASQFVHTIKTKSISGLSLNRTVLDTVSLVLWVGYAARLEDIPLLTATSCELFMSLCVCILILKANRNKTVIVGIDFNKIKISPDSSRSPSESDSFTISVKSERSERRNSI